jgi:hypothetical protein
MSNYLQGLLRVFLFKLYAYEKGNLNLMFRSIIPFLLASLGFALISWATGMSLFEWQFSDIVTDFSSPCNGALPSHWTTRLGEDLEARDKPLIIEHLIIVVKRSWIHETLGRMSLSYQFSSPYLFIVVMLSISYMWWFLFQDKQNRIFHVVMAVFLTVVIVIFTCYLLLPFVTIVTPPVGSITYYYEIWKCDGAITISARLSKVHYETFLVILAGILSEVGAFVVIVRQIRKVVRNR